MDVRCFVVTLQHARVYVCTLLWVYWLAHANDINFVPVCVRVRVCVMCIHIWSVVMNQCECAFVLNVCMRVWIYVCFNSCGVCCVLVPLFMVPVSRQIRIHFEYVKVLITLEHSMLFFSPSLTIIIMHILF